MDSYRQEKSIITEEWQLLELWAEIGGTWEDFLHKNPRNIVKKLLEYRRARAEGEMMAEDKREAKRKADEIARKHGIKK